MIRAMTIPHSAPVSSRHDGCLSIPRDDEAPGGRPVTLGESYGQSSQAVTHSIPAAPLTAGMSAGALANPPPVKAPVAPSHRSA